ncbi:MAG: hypothetical protein ABXS91_08585 [Sulfurimonas sp.]
MAKVKQVSRVKSTNTTRKTYNNNPIMHHRLQNEKIDKSLSKKTDTRVSPLTIQEHSKAIQLYLRYYKGGVSIKNALDHSLDDDIQRARTQLRAFYIRNLSKEVFRFTVKASGLYQATSHQVELQWDLSGIDLDSPAKDIFLNAPIKFQCSCGRHTYWYRYIWTVLRSSLGVQEHRFPRVRNPQAKGMLCKHGVKVLTTLHSTAFQNTFARYIENKRNERGTHISQKDKAKIAGTSFNS